jgi:nitrate reductase cytochrome c-type subunit
MAWMELIKNNNKCLSCLHNAIVQGLQHMPAK